jgi:hypothetical protein
MGGIPPAWRNHLAPTAGDSPTAPVTIVLLVPYRAAERWSWFAAFILPAWAILVPIAYLAFGLAPGAAPSPPMISGPIFAVISVLELVANRRRFATG